MPQNVSAIHLQDASNAHTNILECAVFFKTPNNFCNFIHKSFGHRQGNPRLTYARISPRANDYLSHAAQFRINNLLHQNPNLFFLLRRIITLHKRSSFWCDANVFTRRTSQNTKYSAFRKSIKKHFSFHMTRPMPEKIIFW